MTNQIRSLMSRPGVYQRLAHLTDDGLLTMVEEKEDVEPEPGETERYYFQVRYYSITTKGREKLHSLLMDLNTVKADA